MLLYYSYSPVTAVAVSESQRVSTTVQRHTMYKKSGDEGEGAQATNVHCTLRRRENEERMSRQVLQFSGRLSIFCLPIRLHLLLLSRALLSFCLL